jgi:hypothetical protein
MTLVSAGGLSIQEKVYRGARAVGVLGCLGLVITATTIVDPAKPDNLASCFSGIHILVFMIISVLSLPSNIDLSLQSPKSSAWPIFFISMTRLDDCRAKTSRAETRRTVCTSRLEPKT